MRDETSARKGTDTDAERHRVLTDGGDEIAACPQCNGSQVYARESMSPRWRCAACGATFDEPTYRTPSHLRAASHADPDDTDDTDDLEVGPSDLTAFQIEALRAIASIEDVQYGLAIKRKLERYYGTDVNHGRLYPNLDELVDRGLVEKGELDNRTNHYALTSAGVRLLETRLDQLSTAVDAHHATDDETDRADSETVMADGGRPRDDGERTCARCDESAALGSRFCDDHGRPMTDGGRDRPAFIDPNTQWVECYLCGAELVVGEDPIDGHDVSEDHEYYPDMRPVCGGESHIGNPMADGGIHTTDPRLGAKRATEPYGEVLEAAHGRLDDDDPDMIFLVTARVDERSSYQRGSAAWTGATVGKRPAAMRPSGVSDQELADELIEHVLATLLLETELDGADLAERLAEIEAAMQFDPAGGSQP